MFDFEFVVEIVGVAIDEAGVDAELVVAACTDAHDLFGVSSIEEIAHLYIEVILFSDSFFQFGDECDDLYAIGQCGEDLSQGGHRQHESLFS